MPDKKTIRTSELFRAGISIKRGDSRLKKGITMDNLTASEFSKLKELRKREGRSK